MINYDTFAIELETYLTSLGYKKMNTPKLSTLC